MKFDELKKKVGIFLAIVICQEKLSTKIWKSLSPDNLAGAYEEDRSRFTSPTGDMGKGIILAKIKELKLIKTFDQWKRVFIKTSGGSTLQKMALTEMSKLAKTFDQYLTVFKKAPASSGHRETSWEKMSKLVSIE